MKDDNPYDTPAKYVKSRGLKSVNQIIKETGVSGQTLTNWFKNKIDLFDVVVEGCLARQIAREAREEQKGSST